MIPEHMVSINLCTDVDSVINNLRIVPQTMFYGFHQNNVMFAVKTSSSPFTLAIKISKKKMIITIMENSKKL